MPTNHEDMIYSEARWLPEKEHSRFRRELIYRAMFNNSDPEFLVRKTDWKDRPVETFTSQFVKLTAFTYANMLFGEFPSFRVGGRQANDLQDILRAIHKETRLQIQLMSSAIGQSVEGRSYLRLRRGKFNSTDTKDRVIIESVNSQGVVRMHDQGNRMFPTGFILWDHVIGADGNDYIKFEIHYPGMIVNQIWSAKKEPTISRPRESIYNPNVDIRELMKDELRFKVPFFKLIDRVSIDSVFPNPPEGFNGSEGNMGGQINTGVDNNLVFEIDNQTTNGWSMPDLTGSENVVRMMEDRLSRDAEILNKHANPKLAVPSGVLDEQGEIKRSTFDGMTFEVDPGSGLLVPQYITWEPRLAESEKFFDKMLAILLVNTGLTHQIVGFKSQDGFATSGTALRLRMIPTIARVTAKTMQYDAVMEEMNLTALKLAREIVRFGGFEVPDGLDIQTDWRDGIPDDPIDNAKITQIRTANAPTMSQFSAVKLHNPDMSEESIQNELERIRQDDALQASPQGNSGSGGNQPTIRPLGSTSNNG